MAENIPLLESFSFEEWAKLWAEDPSAAEARRAAETVAFIDSAPPHLRHKLECMQWRVDRERERHDNPMGSAAALTKMVVEMYSKQGGLADQILGPLQEADRAARKMSHPNIVTETPRRHPALTVVSTEQEK